MYIVSWKDNKKRNICTAVGEDCLHKLIEFLNETQVYFKVFKDGNQVNSATIMFEDFEFWEN